MNNKKLIRLTESDLHRIVRESVNRVLRESDYTIGVDSIERTPFGDVDLKNGKMVKKPNMSRSENDRAIPIKNPWIDDDFDDELKWDDESWDKEY